MRSQIRRPRRPPARGCLCLLLMSTIAAAGPAAAQSGPAPSGQAQSGPAQSGQAQSGQFAATGTAQVVQTAGDRPSFARDGERLSLRIAAGETVEASLPPSAGVVTVARDGDAVWVAGHMASLDGGPLFLAEVGADGTVTPLAEPAGRRQARTFPTLLAEHRRVAGIVWQEGDQQESNSIRAAAWLGGDWGPVEIVSPPRGRAQTGLTATVLEDGSWLVVWAAVDEDDDLWWSRRVGAAWSEPRRVHTDNGVPDVLPRLASTGDGALLAWTRFDGRDYRLRLAVLDGVGWSERPVAGGRGAEPVRWLALEGGPALLSSSVVPEVWSVERFDDAGRALSRDVAPQASSEEPMVVERGGELVLRWPPVTGETVALERRMTPAREGEE